MDFKIGDKVKFKKGLMSGVRRQGQIGTVIKVYNDLPGQAGPHVDIEFAGGEIEPGFRIGQIEHA